MRRIGNTLMVVGAVLGVVAGAWIWIGPTAGGLAWLIGVGLIKLTLTAGLALIATGAVALRIANSRETERLSRGAAEVPETRRPTKPSGLLR